MTVLLALRRARRDLGVLLVWVLLVAFAVAISVGLPRLLLSTVDAGARQAVAAAGSNTDVVIGADVTNSDAGQYAPVKPADIVSLASAIPHRLPASIRQVAAGSTLTVLGPATNLASVDGVAGGSLGTDNPVTVQLGLLTPSNTKALSLQSGTLPTGVLAHGAIGVVVSAASARAAGLSLGSTAEVSTIPVSSAVTGGDLVAVRVVGIVSEKSGAAAASQWSDTPYLWTPLVPARPTTPGATATPIRVAMLTSEAGMNAASHRYSTPFKATIRVRLDPAKFTAAREADVGAELIVLSSRDTGLAGNTGAQLGLSSTYGIALADFPAQERAAVAQISVMAAGVLGVAAAVILLVSRMLVSRRETELALERARGASLVSIASRALLETLVTGVVGVALGLLVLQLASPGPFAQPELLGFVLVVTVLAVPVQTVLLVRGTWSGRKVPANRSDRLEALRRVRARRIGIEFTIVALAIAAFVSLDARGLLETQTNGVDLLLASAPLLLAASITIVVLRIYRFPLMLGIAAGRRSNGALGLLAAVRAQRSIAVFPLLALTLAVALAVGGGLLSSSVAAGQQTASWQRIGADVRARSHTPVSSAQLASIASTPGVTAATAFGADQGLQLRLSSGTDFGTLVTTDTGFAPFVRQLPTAGASADGAAALARLDTASVTDGSLPVVVDRTLAAQIAGNGSGIGLYLGLKFIPLRVVGVTDESLSGYLGSPFLFVSQSALKKVAGNAVAVNTILVNGPGASAAVAKLGLPASAVHSRATWLAQRQHLALVAGVDAGVLIATLATALLAILALVVTLLSGARERGRSLALIRTLGLRAGLGWWLALAEIGPVLLAALVGGIVSGVAIVLLLEPAMGLQELAGGLGYPAPTISPLLIIGLAATAIVLLAVSVLIELLVRRRDRLSEVLRVGGSI